MLTPSWEDRLAAMDHSRGTSDRMRKAAMLAEIKDLRKLLRPTEVAWRAAKIAQMKAGKTEHRLQAKLKVAIAAASAYRHTLRQVRLSRDEWKAAALKYQRMLIEKNKP